MATQLSEGQTQNLLSQRITRCSKIFNGLLILFGVGAAIAQLLKPFLGDGGFNLSDGIALLVGLFFVWVGQSGAIASLLRSALSMKNQAVKWGLFATPFLLTLGVAGLKLAMNNNRSYKLLMGEGGFVEYATVIAFVLVGVFAWPLAQGFRRGGEKLLALGYFGLTGLAAFVALEEISWGQTLLGWQESAFFESYNVQEETNLHNLVWFQQYLGDAVILGSLGLLGLCVVWPGLRKRVSARLRGYGDWLVPEWCWAGCFLITLVVYVALEGPDSGGFLISRDQEFVELLFAGGILGSVVSKYLKQGRGA